MIFMQDIMLNLFDYKVYYLQNIIQDKAHLVKL